MEPLDLTRRPPRSCYEELDGLMLMPRTIDKLRALLPGGNPGEYFIDGKIPGISTFLLQRLGVTEADLRDVVRAANDENEIAVWLRDRTDTSRYPELNETLRRIRLKHVSDMEYFAGLYGATLAERPELERVVDIIDADDDRMFAN
jgi:hypothetical protein